MFAGSPVSIILVHSPVCLWGSWFPGSNHHFKSLNPDMISKDCCMVFWEAISWSYTSPATRIWLAWFSNAMFAIFSIASKRACRRVSDNPSSNCPNVFPNCQSAVWTNFTNYLDRKSLYWHIPHNEGLCYAWTKILVLLRQYYHNKLPSIILKLLETEVLLVIIESWDKNYYHNIWIKIGSASRTHAFLKFIY